MADHKLDIFKTLSAIDKREFDYYSKLTDEEAKGFMGRVVMRWTSGPSNIMQLYLLNEYANFDFDQIAKHPELQYKLLCAASLGQKSGRTWIPQPKQSKSRGAIKDFLLKYWPNINEVELNIVYDSFTKDSFKEFVYGCGLTQAEEKKICDSYNKTRV